MAGRTFSRRDEATVPELLKFVHDKACGSIPADAAIEQHDPMCKTAQMLAADHHRILESNRFMQRVIAELTATT